jgi:hypothetical protein
MIKLHKFGPVGDVCDASPFCVKVEAYLRLAGLPYDTRSGAQYLRKAPKGKLPYIEDKAKLIAGELRRWLLKNTKVCTIVYI